MTSAETGQQQNSANVTNRNGIYSVTTQNGQSSITQQQTASTTPPHQPKAKANHSGTQPSTSNHEAVDGSARAVTTEDKLWLTPIEVEEQLYGDSSTTANTSTTAEEYGRIMRSGMRSLPAMKALRRRILAFYDVQSFTQITPKMVLDWIKTLKETTNPRTRAEYLKLFIRISEDLQMNWDRNLPSRIIKGLMAEAPPPNQADTLTIENFHRLKEQLDPITSLAATYTFLTGSRLDETFNIEASMIQGRNARAVTEDMRLNPEYIIIKVETGSMSKSGPTQPKALRFTDVAILNPSEAHTMKERMRQGGPIFPKESKEILLEALKRMNYTGHSIRRGTTTVLTRLLTKGKIQEPMIPFILKHSDAKHPIPAVTVEYLGPEARINILKAEGVFAAAVEIRQELMGDCFTPRVKWNL